MLTVDKDEQFFIFEKKIIIYIDVFKVKLLALINSRFGSALLLERSKIYILLTSCIGVGGGPLVRTNTGFNRRGTSSKLPPTLSWRAVSIEGAITSYHTASARALAIAYVYAQYMQYGSHGHVVCAAAV